MWDLKFVLTETVDDIDLYIDPGIASKTLEDRKPIRTESHLSSKSKGLLWS